MFKTSIFGFERQKVFLCSALPRFQVPGLQEGRPSVTVGDRVLLTREGAADSVLEGFVHEVRREEVLLQFHQSVHQNYDPLATFRVEVRPPSPLI